MNVILDEKARRTHRVLAVMQGASGEPKRKQARQNGSNPMPIENLLNPEPIESKKGKGSKRASKKKDHKKKAKHKPQTFKAERPEKYDVVSALTNAQSGITFGHLWQGNAAYARKELDRIFGKGQLKLGVVEEREQNDEDTEEKCLAVAPVRIHGMELYALMDSGATPNVLSPSVVKWLSLNPEGTKKVVTVATGDKSGAQGKLTNIQVLFEQLQAGIDFIILENVPFDVVIGRPTLKRLGGVLDFKAEVVRLD